MEAQVSVLLPASVISVLRVKTQLFETHLQQGPLTASQSYQQPNKPLTSPKSTKLSSAVTSTDSYFWHCYFQEKCTALLFPAPAL